MTLPPNARALSDFFSLNTASLALFRVLTAAAIFWHLGAHHSPVFTLLLSLPLIAFALGYRTRMMALGLLIVATVFILLNWGTPSSYDIWMALLSAWSACLPVNAQWGMDAGLQKTLKTHPNSTDSLMPRTHRISGWFAHFVVVLVLTTTVLNLITSTIDLSVFNLAALSVLTPAWFWQKLITALKSSVRYQNIQKLIIYYDADCGFCLKMCLVLRECLLTRDTNIITAQSNDKIFAIMEANNSWVIQSADGHTHIHWHAMQVLFSQRMPFTLIARIMALPPLMRMGNQLYAWVAVNRATMGRITERGLPWVTIPTTASRATSAWVVVFSIALLWLQITATVL